MEELHGEPGDCSEGMSNAGGAFEVLDLVVGGAMPSNSQQKGKDKMEIATCDLVTDTMNNIIKI